jgi:capsular polysaccharide biosynthesis protein/tetratricopeptide (TPR) repeat protein
MHPENNEQKLERAIRLHNEGKLDAAEALYREVLRDKPGHQAALHLSGLVAHQRGRYREAVTLIEMALAGGATNAAIHTNCGVAYHALGELDKAARHIGWALALDPEFAAAHFNYALVLLDQGLAHPAAAHLEIALELRQDSPKASFYLGRIRLDEDKPALAAERLRAALQLEPEHVEAHYLLARALIALGDTRAALQSLSAVLKLQPEHGDAAYFAAKASFELCHEGAALAYLDQALRNSPAAEGATGLRAARARLGQIDLWCTARGERYTRLAGPQWLRLAQPKALPEDELRHFILPKPFALEIFLARVTRVRVLPKDLLLLSSDGHLFLDGFVRFAQQYALREGGAIRHCADDGRLLLAVPERCLALEEPCVWLGAGSGHFQWVFESLARLWVIEQQPALQDLPLIVQASLTRWQEELLQLLGYGAERRIEVPADAMLECRELHAASMVSVGNFISPMAIQHLRRELVRRVAPASDAPRRIYLSRQGAATRRLANEAELLPLLEQHGFVAVDAQGMSAAEQLALFQCAECILGVEGAALVNLFIAPAHARVGVIVARGLYQPRHYYVSAPIGHDFTYLCAEPDYASHAVLAECDVALAREVLEAFLAAC